MWYTAPLQKSFSFASYWRDPTRLGMYRELSPFLADINNERAVKNQSYVDRITSLTHFVLVMSRRDTIIVPRESSWFGFYRENSTRVMQTMEETPLYREDWLGLKRLRESGRAYNPAPECAAHAFLRPARDAAVASAPHITTHPSYHRWRLRRA